MTLRIKSEQEFINEFGKDWMRKVRLHWVHEMNFLHNKLVTLTDKEYNLLKDGGSCHMGGWNISMDMLTEYREPVTQPLFGALL